MLADLQLPDAGSIVLTAPGGDFPLDDSLREVMCYMDDGRLFVSKSHMTNPHVTGFIARLHRLGRPCKVLQVDMAVIARQYEHGRRAFARPVSLSDMQERAQILFQQAVELRASDIHIRVSERNKTEILFRIHNDLTSFEQHSYEFGNQLCTAIYQSMADVADSTFERLSRQDARISDINKIPAGVDGIRIATSPQVAGYIMVLRLLYNDTSESLSPEELGYSSMHCNCLSMMKRRPTGANIISGPTGSGKSTTLQRLMASIIKECGGSKHVITVEDPPEYPIVGAVQTPVTNAQTGEERSEAFQLAIKASMRLDPDVIMIGEIRDTASARLAVEAAMTGHQVWSTLHANSAFAIIDRLVDLGVPLELVSDSTIFTGLVCQRLLKTLCPRCKLPLDAALGRYAEIDVERVRRAVPDAQIFVVGDGCEVCRYTGISGRTVVAETVLTNERLMTYIRRQQRQEAIAYWREALGGTSMFDHALSKIGQGLVDPFHTEDVVGTLDAMEAAGIVAAGQPLGALQ